MALDGQLQGLIQVHGVPEDVQIAIGASLCASVGMISEFFKDKEAVKADAPLPSC